MSEIDNLKDVHKCGYKGLLKTYSRRVLLDKSAYISLSLSIVLITLLLLFNKDSFKLIDRITELVVVIFPSLLGFCIGGYAIIIGFGQKNIIEKMSIPMKEQGGLSFYQIVNGVFATSILVQVFTLFIGFIISLVLELNIKTSTQLSDIVNYSTVFIVLNMCFLSLFLLADIVINIFNFAQTAHFTIRIDELSNEKD